MNNEPTKIASIDDYINSCTDDMKDKLQSLRIAIKQLVPDATEKIAWGMPTFYYLGNLVHFAAHKNHIGFYPTPSAIEAFSDKLSDYKRSKGAVQFPNDKTLPFELIEEMVKYRVDENLKKQI